MVVVGGGPAGLAAARAATDAGRRVLLLDLNPRLGGQIWRHRSGDKLPPAARRILASVVPPAVAVAPRATVVDVISPTELVVSFSGRIARIETDAVIIATGAVERLLPFPGWTLPGVVGVGGLQALVKNGLHVGGNRVVIAGSGPLALPVAATLTAARAEVLLIGEQASATAVRRFAARALSAPGRAVQAATLRWATRSTPYRTDCWPLRAIGGERLEQVVMQVGEREQTIDCDWLATNVGLVPRTDLARLLGCSVDHEGVVVDERQATSVPGVFAAGECCGVKGDEGAIVEGTIAGLAAAGIAELPRRLRRRRAAAHSFGKLLEATFAPRSELNRRVSDDTIVCRCEDVRRGQLDPEWTARQAKLWTRIGMGACQGTVCGPACEVMFGWSGNNARPPLVQLPASEWASALTPATDHSRRDEPAQPAP